MLQKKDSQKASYQFHHPLTDPENVTFSDVICICISLCQVNQIK